MRILDFRLSTFLFCVRRERALRWAVYGGGGRRGVFRVRYNWVRRGDRRIGRGGCGIREGWPREGWRAGIAWVTLYEMSGKEYKRAEFFGGGGFWGRVGVEVGQSVIEIRA